MISVYEIASELRTTCYCVLEFCAPGMVDDDYMMTTEDADFLREAWNI